jgi:hypothetical protein
MVFFLNAKSDTGKKWKLHNQPEKYRVYKWMGNTLTVNKAWEVVRQSRFEEEGIIIPPHWILREQRIVGTKLRVFSNVP